jgi:hypothetical protein
MIVVTTKGGAMTTKVSMKFGDVLSELPVKHCRMVGQGLVEGEKYRISEMQYEVLGRDMILTEGKVVDWEGTIFNVLNLHIAFDLEDIFAREGI